MSRPCFWKGRMASAAMGRRHLDAPRLQGGVQVWDASLLGPLHACPKPLPTARVAQGVAAVRRRPRHGPRRHALSAPATRRRGQSPQGPGRGGPGEPLACGRGPWLSSALLWVSSPVGLWSTSSPCSAASTVSHTELVEDGGTPEGFACALRGVSSATCPRARLLSPPSRRPRASACTCR